MSRDDLNDIPSFAASRDEAVSSAPRGAIPPRAARAQGKMGVAARLTLTVALAAAGVACGWAWQLQMRGCRLSRHATFWSLRHQVVEVYRGSCPAHQQVGLFPLSNVVEPGDRLGQGPSCALNAL